MIIICILALLFLFSIMMYFQCSVSKIRPDECLGVGRYYVLPGQAGSIQSNCSSTQTQNCIFNVNNLQDAINICNADDRCRAFTLNENEMWYTDINSVTSSNPAVNTYYKGVNVIRLTSGL
jgi:hypothetical protein